ncbi:kinesin-like protein KIN-7J [Abrus precatorius]|uniref:Kinesin-like protein KIN-7J n=1 Tax=Abrus precatorius TaxID=3816 RepID=A0A8B8LQ34_ABRPR|nr:kinesin-like protein KIN-7J [Abrus precatorius]
MTQEERIFVSIRVRPLNERERARHDVSDWECVSGHTLRFKGNGHAEQRALSTDSYTFDRVFGDRCNTKQVYEQGIKEVALSVVNGINSSIFAYGQTSSGKTYTMTGITEYAVRDIYQYIEKRKDREFVVKFSAMEIYNEAVRDLLNAGGTSLRLLDDPEKGTFVEKLTEETLRERSQLQQLLSICAAERTTEETAMNETSSRSHQILRLVFTLSLIESNPSNFAATARSGTLTANVNFVDLAGSERASQALSAGTRLREGSHINRSLLTLGTVIRKLSKGRNEHIPYRDSKLTRILHNSLGGNARTAIICTISPARSQIEQSRNTLLFAGCAKQVATNARINLVMSDKVLVKQLQRELARLENELRKFTPNTVLLKERELQIEQMDKEIKELTRQRDQFQSHVENFRHSAGKDRVSRVDKDSASESSRVAKNLPRMNSISENLDTTTNLSISHEHLLQQTENSEDYFLLDGSSPTFGGPDPCQGWEEMASRAESQDNCEEVSKAESQDNCEEVSKAESEDICKEVSSDEYEDNCREVPCIEIKEVEKDRQTDLNTPIPVFEENGGVSPTMDIDAESSLGGNLPTTQVVDVDAKSFSGENSPMIKVVNVDARSSSGNGQNGHCESIHVAENDSQDNLSEKSSGSSESEPHILAPMSLPQTDEVDQENSAHPQVSKLEQNASPSRFNKLNQEPASPPQFDEQELKTTLPPKLDEQEQVSVTLPDEVDRENATSLACFQDNQPESKLHATKRKSSRKYSAVHDMNASVEDVESAWDSDAEDTASVLNFVVAMNQKAKIKPLNCDLDDIMVRARKSGISKRVNQIKGISFHGVPGALVPYDFERQQRDIIQLWDACNVPLVHRTYFFLLIKGELSDSVYLDVELRRLSFLKDTFFGGTSITGDGRDVTPNSSLTSLNRERKMLSKHVHKKFSRKEREELYQKWGIDLKSKHRSVQLAWLVWTNTKDLTHVRESAALVAKLVGFINSGEATKKTFGFGFLTRRKTKNDSTWKDTMSTVL